MEGVDGSVGTIVWVRRRNGSWWPGRILGQDELSASHLMSPRSGTPVKLLGREDASVDWYNLEKSKRVKAFRCGEFDACIERAEASQGIPIKKREKYARREDAILHALELEKQQIGMKHQEIGIPSNVVNNKTLGARRREFNSFPSSNDYMRGDEPGVNSKFANHKSQMFSKKAAQSHDEEDNLYVHKAAKSKKATSTEHNPEALPRMRGLQDFGLRIAPPKKKFSQSTWETSYKPVNNHLSVHSTAGHMMGSANHSGGSKNSPSIKRKRSQGATSEDSLVKKRDRRRPLVQVLQSSTQLPVSHSFQSGYDSVTVSMQGEIDHMGSICRAKRSRCVYLPADSNDSLDNGGSPSEQIPVETRFGTGNYLGQRVALAEDETSSATTEETESDSSETESSEPDMDENGLRDTTQILLPGSRNCDPPDIHISENFGDPHDDEKPHPGYIPLVHRQDQMMNATADVGVSKWHMKGKRNIRQLPKRPMDPMDGRNLFGRANGFVRGTTYENRGSGLKMRTEPFSQKAAGQSLDHKREAYDYAFDGGDILEGEGRDHLMGYGNQRNSLILQADKDPGRSQNSFNASDSDSHLLSPSLWEADGPSSHMRRAYWDEADECYNPFYAGTFGDEMDLIDVDLKVQAATYQGEHVPLVSLMSRLNGKAIIGHPVQIEILEDGSTGQLLAKYNAELDESAPPSAVWKTARRSVMLRVPRSGASASALEGEEDDPLPDSDPEGKPSPRKPYSSYFNHQARLAKRSVSHSRRPSVPGKFQKKPLKRVNLSSQKTRTLSSLANEHRRGAENGGVKHSRHSGLLDGLIRPDGAAPLVTCVPVKVVFSRILEALSRPSSASAHRARMANPAARAPP